MAATQATERVSGVKAGRGFSPEMVSALTGGGDCSDSRVCRGTHATDVSRCGRGQVVSCGVTLFVRFAC
jgi:hypothetical protein